MKTTLMQCTFPIALIAGIFSGFYFPSPFQPTFLACILLTLIAIRLLDKRYSVSILILVLVSAVSGNLAATTMLQRHMEGMPSPEDLDKTYKITARVLYQWETKYGTALRVDRIRVLSPKDTSWRLPSMTVYIPPLDGVIPPRTEMTTWIRLKRQWPSKPIPRPMQKLRETYMPRLAGSVKSLRLLELQKPPKTRQSLLSPANEELIALFTRGIPSWTWRERLAPFGLGHLLAISGMHCIIVYFLIQVLILPVRGPVLRIGLSALGLLAFAHWVGWPVSVTRAAIMLIVWQALPIWNRPRRWIHLWTGLLILTLIRK
jgi:hypothetical protein